MILKELEKYVKMTKPPKFFFIELDEEPHPETTKYLFNLGFERKTELLWSISLEDAKLLIEGEEQEPLNYEAHWENEGERILERFFEVA